MSIQSSKTIMMVEPTCFRFNESTANSNAFQVEEVASAVDCSSKAFKEFDSLARKIESSGVKVLRRPNRSDIH
jgi:hypothetical protein